MYNNTGWKPQDFDLE